VLREVWDYIRFDRAELIEQARRRGTYGELTGKSLVEDPHHAAIAPRAGGDRRRPVEHSIRGSGGGHLIRHCPVVGERPLGSAGLFLSHFCRCARTWGLRSAGRRPHW